VFHPIGMMAARTCVPSVRDRWGNEREGASSRGAVITTRTAAVVAPGALFLRAVIDVSAVHGSNYVAHGYSAGTGLLMELILTLGLVSVILGTASGAQNIGIIAALGVAGYIALAGLWGSPILERR